MVLFHRCCLSLRATRLRLGGTENDLITLPRLQTLAGLDDLVEKGIAPRSNRLFGRGKDSFALS